MSSMPVCDDLRSVNFTRRTNYEFSLNRLSVSHFCLFGAGVWFATRPMWLQSNRVCLCGFSTSYGNCMCIKDVCKIAFLLRCMECSRTIAMGILSVRPSVCPSDAWIVTKRKKDMFRFLYHTSK